MNSLLLSKYRNAITITAIAIVSLLMHWSIFQRDLIGIHVWRQSQTQLNITNFYRVGNNILHPRVNILDANGEQLIIRTDFPLMQWIVAQVYRVVGESIIVTRVCMFLLGLITTTGFFRLSLVLFKEFRVAAMAAWAFSFSPVFYYYTLNPIPDNLALCFAVWSLFCFVRYTSCQKNIYAWLSAALLGLAALVKLPYVLFGAVYAHAFIFSVFNSGNKTINRMRSSISFALPYVLFIVPAAIWYYTVIPEWGENVVLKGNFNYSEQAGRVKEILSYHFTTMFPQLLLNYAAVVLLCCGVYSIFKKRYYKRPLFWQIGSGFLFVVLYFMYEFFPIDIIHDYYLMPFLPFLFLLVTAGIHLLFSYGGFVNYILAVAIVLMPLLAFKTVQNNWTVERSYTNDFVIIHQEEFKKAIPSNAPVIFLNDVSLHIWPYLLDKKGYIFTNDQLPKEWIEDMIKNKNIRYMYSDSRVIDTSAAYQYLFDTVLLQKGTLKLIRLKSQP